MQRHTRSDVLRTMCKPVSILTSSGKYFLGELVNFENESCFTKEFQDF